MESGYLKRLLAVVLMSFAAISGISASDLVAGTDALTRARDFRDAGKIDDAIATYERSVELDPSLVDAWLGLILLLTEVSQHRRALETSERAVRELPNEPRILARLVFSLATSPDEAIRDGERAVEVAERLFEVETAYVTARLVAVSHAEADRCEDALDWMQRAIALAEAKWEHPWVPGPVSQAQVVQALSRHRNEIANSPICGIATPKSVPDEHPGRTYALQHCQTCHLFVEPGMLERQVWEDYVIPNMGAFLGMHNAGYDYDVFPGRSPIEREIIARANVYPDEAQVPKAEWDALVAYFLDQAPAAPPPRESEPEARIGLDQFRVVEFAPSRKTPATTLVNIANGRLFVGDFERSSLTVLDGAGRVIQELNTPHAPIALRHRNRELWVTDIGSVFPSDMPLGNLLVFRHNGSSYGSSATRLTNLQRPVHTTYGDINQDGVEDLVVSEFGHRAGRLMWYEGREDGGYTPHVLLNEPGAITSYLRDLDGDGRKDIVAAFGQSREGVHIFHNLGDGSFRHTYALPLPPTYGTNFFALHDFNGDGFADVLATNGDNGDYVSEFPKSHHGIRIYLNDGRNTFVEQFFFPLYGASKALAVDFDADGDLDIAGIAMFADFMRHPEAGFVYLENQGDLQFDGAHTPEAADGRWVAMDAGDMDGDEDIDIVLGSFIEGPGAVPTVLMQRWRDLERPLLYLENQLK
ncbi:MAG: FG-GAP-like repeat-containing protein [Gammaproteobacteria bacterium]|nr:FG-GAP-like repeat-containing protein [Gammaproteobacteria bacterium]